ncbi:MAG: pilus assembly protein N-terminal domain-containing protein [Armatimonadetes bacterium]|nr:pilus assembly protein N-terminal domain-containing protein [Armatimonadota bacterium]
MRTTWGKVLCSSAGSVMLAALLTLWSGPASAQNAAGDDIVVTVGGETSVKAGGYVRQSAIPANVVEVVCGPEAVTLRGLQAGRASVVLWDNNDKARRLRVNVMAAGQTAAPAGNAPAPAGTTPTVVPAVAGGPGLPPVVAPSGPLAPLRMPSVQVDGGLQGQPIELMVNEAVPLSVPTQLRRIHTANEAIADVVVMPPREAVLIGKAPGETTVIVWYVGGDAYLGEMQRITFPVRVVAPPVNTNDGGLAALRDQALSVMAKKGITGVELVTAGGSQNISLLLVGTVESKEQVKLAETIVAALFPTGTRIANLLTVPVRSLSEADLLARAKALEKLLAQELPNSEVHVQLRPDAGSDRLRVWLSGTAYQPADRIKAEELTRFDLGPTAEINNNLETPLPPTPPELANLALTTPASGAATGPTKPIEEAVMASLEMTSALRDGVQVRFHRDQKRIELVGSVRNDDDRSEIVDAVTEVAQEYGDYEVRDRGLVVKPAKVVTTVQIVELTDSDNSSLGFTYGLPVGGQASQSNSGTGGSSSTVNTPTTTLLATNGELAVYGQRQAGDPFKMLEGFASSIRALVTQNRARVLSEPVIASDNEVEGRFEVVDEIPLPSSTSGNNGQVGTSVEYKPVGIRLILTPSIHWGEPDSQIELNIETEVSAVDYGKAATINGTTVPAITQRRAKTVVTINDHETLVLGGLTTESEQRNVSRLPFLSDIPLLGQLFRYKDNKRGKTTIVVVLTPRIVN